MLLRSGKTKPNSKYKAKRRGSIWIPLEIWEKTCSMKYGAHERRIWRALTKKEIINLMKIELRNERINSNDSKLKLIRQWRKHGNPGSNRLVEERHSEWETVMKSGRIHRGHWASRFSDLLTDPLTSQRVYHIFDEHERISNKHKHPWWEGT